MCCCFHSPKVRAGAIPRVRAWSGESSLNTASKSSISPPSIRAISTPTTRTGRTVKTVYNAEGTLHQKNKSSKENYSITSACDNPLQIRRHKTHLATKACICLPVSLLGGRAGDSETDTMTCLKPPRFVFDLSFQSSKGEEEQEERQKGPNGKCEEKKILRTKFHAPSVSR